MRPQANTFPAADGGRHGRTLDRRRRGLAAGWLVFVVFVLAGSLRANPAGEPAALRFGFSSQVFGEVNENDARAALKVWSLAMSAERGVPIDPAMQILNGAEAIQAALLGRTIDMLTMTAAEFWAVRRVAPLGPIFIGRTHGETSEEYLLLVHHDNPAARLADFRGRSVAVLQGSRATLAAIWMETLLLEEHLGTAGTFWGRIERAGKLSRIVLPVFFQQVDACVVTREGFRTMSELNPQVGRQLRILAQSPAVVPTVFCFRGDLVSPYRDKLISGIAQIADTPAGRQTLALFQSDQIEVRPVAEMDTACALLDRHQRLLAEAGNANATNSGGAAPPDAGERSR